MNMRIIKGFCELVAGIVTNNSNSINEGVKDLLIGGAVALVKDAMNSDQGTDGSGDIDSSDCGGEVFV